MKKYILIALAVLTIAGATTAFIIRNDVTAIKEKPTPVGTDIRDVSELKELGFVNVGSVVSREESILKKRYLEAYGCNYYSDREIISVLQENEWVVAPSSSYTGEIPDAAAKLMLANVHKITSKEEKLDRYDYVVNEFVNEEVAWQRYTDHYKNYDVELIPLVFIAAPKSKIDLTKTKFSINQEALLIPKNVDPIALYRVKTGWVELARW